MTMQPASPKQSARVWLSHQDGAVPTKSLERLLMLAVFLAFAMI
jgi:hypothetical protein